MKEFWRQSCIRFVTIDGTFTKLNDFKHTIMLAVTYDANNNLVVLAMGICDVENEPNWVWFQEHLQRDFEGFTLIMSDADKGITSEGFSQSLSQYDEDAVTSRCVRHLSENLREAFPYQLNETHKLMILSLAKSRTEEVYQERLGKIAAIHHEWGEWLDARKEQFVTKFFLDKGIPRWGKVTSNGVENMNSSFLGIRERPISGNNV